MQCPKIVTDSANEAEDDVEQNINAAEVAELATILETNC